MHWALCLLVCAAVCLRQVPASPMRTFTKKANRAAPQDQVNILTYGVIQFRETLSHVYETTEAKIAQISRSVRSHEGSLQRLGKETEKAAEVERQIKEVLGRLQVQMAGLQAQTNVTKHRLTSVEQDEALLKTKVTDLEKYINNPLPTTIIELQERAELHSNILNTLQHLTGKQKQSLESHSHHLSRLQKMVQKGRHFRTHKKEQQLM